MDIELKIWRRFLVNGSWTFDKLHEVIRIIMGWENYHLFEFKFGNIRITPSDEGFFEEDEIDPEKVKISDYVNKEKQKFDYVYDFGDSWEHKIIVEKIIEEEEFKKYPLYIDGERACPPEDCGGVGGYERLSEFFQTGKDPWEEDEELKEWLGDWKPEKFSRGSE